MSTRQYDVVIVGGGPAGSTAASLLKKYNPALDVLIIEREPFPRDHVGESQLPPIGRILDEMGVWDKVEAANFIVKLGATYTWGKTTEPWVFGFIPDSEVENNPRPEKYAGWRTRVALQVDRAKYDKILLDHAVSMGCKLEQPASVSKVLKSADAVEGLLLDDGREVKARYYLDCSGNAAVLRRAMGVKVEIPTLLQNVAFWDFWEKPKLNVPLLERNAIRVQIRSLPYGWVWYIALSNDRSSVGLVCPATYFKESGKSPEQLYRESLARETQIASLLEGAGSENNVRRTNDWSFVAERGSGPNWFLVGECLGFADPILAAGLTLTHTCAQHAAYAILELDRGELPADWIHATYSDVQTRRVRQHMKFAEYWYSANGNFSELVDYCANIARQAGLTLTPQAAFRWLSNGGIDDQFGTTALGGLDVAGIRGIQWRLSHETEAPIKYRVHGKSVFKLRLDGAEETTIPVLQEGRIHRIPAFRRGADLLPVVGGYQAVIEALQKTTDAATMVENIRSMAAQHFPAELVERRVLGAIQCLEMMVINDWVKTSEKRGRPAVIMETPKEGQVIYSLKSDT